MKHLINVTQNDIDKGIMSVGCEPLACNCPVARAIKRVFPEQLIVVGYCGPIFIGPKEADLPESAIMFIKQFDNGYPVQPFSFEIEVSN